jgi:hypothetical protein
MDTGRPIRAAGGKAHMGDVTMRVQSRVRCLASPVRLLLAVLLLAAATPAHAISIADCRHLLGRLGFYASAVIGKGGSMRVEPDPLQSGIPDAIFRYEPSRGRIRVITLTKDVEDCLAAFDDFDLFTIYADLRTPSPSLRSLQANATTTTLPTIV